MNSAPEKGQWIFDGSRRLRHASAKPRWMPRGWELEVAADGASLTVLGVAQKPLPLPLPPPFFKPSALPLGDEIRGGFHIAGIGEYAFFSCKAIGSAALPRGVASIGEGAFQRCRNLTNVAIPDSVIDIGCWAFFDCGKLADAVIPRGVAKIGAHAFGMCGSLSGISVAEGNRDFCGVDGVVFSKDKSRLVLFPAGRGGAHEIPDGVARIDAGAFSGCASLERVAIPDSVLDIGESAFEDCASLASVRIGRHARGIGERAFDSCRSLKELDIPDSVTEIGNWAFEDCDGLASIKIGRGATNIGPDAFSDCGKTATIFVSPENPVYCAINGKELRRKSDGALLFPKAGTGE